MVYVRSRKFCCCIPVRAGVFILSLAGAVLGILISIVGWRQVSQLRTNPLPTPDTIALYLHVSVFTLLTVLSLFGFIGTLVKQRNFVSAYAGGLMMTLILSLCSGIFALYTLFKQNSSDAMTDCLNGATDEASKAACKGSIVAVKAVAVVIYVIVWLLQIYAYIIVSNYVDQLDEEMSVKETRQMIQAISQPAQVTTYAVPQSAGYAFAHPGQSYGIRGNNSNNV